MRQLYLFYQYHGTIAYLRKLTTTIGPSKTEVHLVLKLMEQNLAKAKAKDYTIKTLLTWNPLENFYTDIFILMMILRHRGNVLRLKNPKTRLMVTSHMM